MMMMQYLPECNIPDPVDIDRSSDEPDEREEAEEGVCPEEGLGQRDVVVGSGDRLEELQHRLYHGGGSLH